MPDSESVRDYLTDLRAIPREPDAIGDAIGRAVAESIADAIAEYNAERHAGTIVEFDDGSISITYAKPQLRSYGAPDHYPA
jgi:hypothetical protein